MYILKILKFSPLGILQASKRLKMLQGFIYRMQLRAKGHAYGNSSIQLHFHPPSGYHGNKHFLNSLRLSTPNFLLSSQLFTQHSPSKTDHQLPIIYLHSDSRTLHLHKTFPATLRQTTRRTILWQSKNFY